MSETLEPNAARVASSLKIRRVAGALGAEVQGVRLSADLDEVTFTEIKQALNRHKVLFFRNQNHLGDEEQEVFAQRFGTVVPHPTVPSAEGTRALFSVDSKQGARADSWHSDMTFQPNYPKLSLLRAVVTPEAGGDTVWANTTAAYENLPEPLKRLAESLRAVHTNTYDYASSRATVSAKALEYHGVFTRENYETEHPVVRIHPETGERTLLLGHFVKKFQGVSLRDSRRIFELLQEHVVSQDNIVRWSWQPGDVAIWDNRATQHRAINDYGSEPRLLRRSTVEGETPVGLDGLESIPLTTH
ncbi:putative taurine dioxygenase [Neokomagataea thailandica NBRC 106555]|uniref:TauD/TfdA family dioxygenase n=2 Tax=Neokomagataea TaxID=1223423 RepID=A0A4Y6V9S7_9PROT|nr:MULTISPECIES: TauD/TfdA family dioxygenase [Neokomagataea]QDH25207.1 TauD/TfdA family dioxygenase [Neokomagataea tanensis]GBR53444.1 putative taurine dioxygenase [Neokomagataea thailandica NBRC 106555]